MLCMDEERWLPITTILSLRAGLALLLLSIFRLLPNILWRHVDLPTLELRSGMWRIPYFFQKCLL